MIRYVILFFCCFSSAYGTRIPLRENGLVATLFLPENTKPEAMIITLSGSNGGLSENRAHLLSQEGFATLALAYFGADSLPENLANINLEYFESAIKWIESQPNLKQSKIFLYGVSRGAELALLLGATFPNKIDGIVATAPSSMIHSGSNGEHAWLYQGKPISNYAQVTLPESKGTCDNPTSTLSAFNESLNSEFASIPVERICSPILLITGGDDKVWPSHEYALQIINRANNNSCAHLHYPQAGHGINAPNQLSWDSLYYHPKACSWFTFGGSPEEDQKASLDSWQKIVQFFSII